MKYEKSSCWDLSKNLCCIFPTDPTEVEAVENAEVDEDGVVTWEAPARYTACPLMYTLSVSIDGGTPENMSPTSETRYALTDISHCFRVDVVLEAVYEDISGTQNDVSYSEGNYKIFFNSYLYFYFFILFVCNKLCCWL